MLHEAPVLELEQLVRYQRLLVEIEGTDIKSMLTIKDEAVE